MGDITTQLAAKKSIDLKAELSAYLKKRQQAAEREGEEFDANEVDDVFSYYELDKYGYFHLLNPILEAGGCFAMYDLMGMKQPALKPLKVEETPALEVPREEGKTQYSGLKMTEILDDDLFGKKLAESIKKSKERKPREQESFPLPFKTRKSTDPYLRTPQDVDEELRMQAKTKAWARRARDGEFDTERSESLEIEGSLRSYSVASALMISFAFGKSTISFLQDILEVDGATADSIQQALQAPGLALLVASVGSSVVAYVLASQKNRNKFVWGVKGLFGGPAAILELRGLDNDMEVAP